MNSLFWNLSYFWHRKTAKLRCYVAGFVKLQDVVCMMCAHGSFVCFKCNQVCKWSEVDSALLIRTRLMWNYLLVVLFLLWLHLQGREIILNRKPERDCTSGFLKAPLSMCLWYKEVLWCVELFPRILEEVCPIDWGHVWFCWKTDKWINRVIYLNKQKWKKNKTKNKHSFLLAARSSTVCFNSLHSK